MEVSAVIVSMLRKKDSHKYRGISNKQEREAIEDLLRQEVSVTDIVQTFHINTIAVSKLRWKIIRELLAQEVPVEEIAQKFDLKEEVLNEG